MQIGDLIIGARTLIPDLPRTLAPIGNAAASVVAAGGSTLPTGTYYLVLTATNRWGETLQSNQISALVIGANQGIQVTAPALATIPGAATIKAYFAVNGQPLMQWQQSATLPFTISSPGTPGTPPTRSTSFFPDSDGNFVSAYTMYQWVNEALIIASSVAGGIPDTSGVHCVAGQGQYTLPSRWAKLGHAWFNGFPAAFCGSRDMFYRNKLNGITYLALVQQNADRVIMEMQPQPNQTGGETTVAVQVNPGDSTIQLVDTSSIILGLGLFQLGGLSGEIIAYSGVNGNSLTGCSRGLSGTIPATWAVSTDAQELNWRYNGQRKFDSPLYTVGMSSATIAVPPEWQRPLIDYLLNKAREGEQSPQEAQRKLQEFSGYIKAWAKGNSLVAGPRQIGGTNNPSDAYPTSGGFGVIIQ